MKRLLLVFLITLPYYAEGQSYSTLSGNSQQTNPTYERVYPHVISSSSYPKNGGRETREMVEDKAGNTYERYRWEPDPTQNRGEHNHKQ